MEDENQVVEHIKNGSPHLASERLVFDGLTHCDIGAWLCKQERFPEDIACVVKYHHTPWKATIYPEITKIIYIANALGTDYVAESLPVDVRTPINNKVLRDLGLNKNDLKKIYEKIPNVVKTYTAKPIGF